MGLGSRRLCGNGLTMPGEHIIPFPSRKGLAFPFLFGMVLLLALACGPAASPVAPPPQESTSTPVSDGNVQTSTEAAAPTPPPTATPPPTSTATPERTKAVQAANSDSRDTSESITQSGGTGGDDGAKPNAESEGTSEDNQAPPIPDKGELKYPNLGSRLDELVASVESGQITPEEAAAEAPVHSGESVAVTIHLSGNAEDVVAYLEENGGDPRNVGEDHIEAYVPVTLLGPASEQPGVLRVREIVPPERGQGG